MSDGLITVVDEQDAPIGSATKQEVWRVGLRHRTVRIIIQNDKGEILLQKRAKTKQPYPGRWDNSVAGHVDAGEDYLAAANREISEETGGLDIPIKEIGYYKSDKTSSDGKILNRYTKVYKGSSNDTPVNFPKDEIEEFKWFKVEEIKKLFSEHPETVTDGLRRVITDYF